MSPPARMSKATKWRAGSLLAVHLLMGLHLLHWWRAGRTLAPVEPSEMFDTLHLGIITVGFLFMLGAVIATSIFGRFFCGWGCHILALQDLSAALLRKLRIPTQPVRSRTLVWVPALAAGYLFVWPPLKRLLTGEALPALHVVSDPQGWSSFTTTDLLRSFPGLGMTITTFIVCGFLLIYFLGSRSFCSYACPYGAIFAAAERVSPLRIIAGPGECSHCDLCVTSCKSNVRVIHEVEKYGAVVDANCLKDLDCVSVCPTGALKYGATMPPLFHSQPEEPLPKKPYDFSVGEDVVMAGVFLATLPIVRGLYDAVSFLLALACCALLAYGSVLAMRLLRDDRVVVTGSPLKERGRLTRRGQFATAGLVILAGLVLHSGYVRSQLLLGELALGQASSAAEARTAGDESLASAGAHFEQAQRWGLVTPAGLRRQIALVKLQSGAPSAARDQLNAILATDPNDYLARLLLAQAWLQESRTELARSQAKMIITASEPKPEVFPFRPPTRRLQAEALCLLGDLEFAAGNQQAALVQFDAAIALDPEHAKPYVAKGAVLASAGEWSAAAQSLEQGLAPAPDSLLAHNNLAAVLVNLQRDEEALEHYQRCVELSPSNPLAYCNVAELLAKLERFEDAERAYQQALALEPDFEPAVTGRAKIVELRMELDSQR
jgi:tetratricopeptide (TPR) repeat protein/ferredoxin